MLIGRAVIAVAAGVLLMQLSAPAPGQTATFQVDPSLSTLQLTGSVQGSSLTQQASGSMSTTYAGPLRLQLSRTNLSFLGGSSVRANNSGNWQPGHHGVAGSAPANYGARFTILFTTGNVAIRDFAFDVTTASPIALNMNGNSGTFSSAVQAAAIDGVSDYNHPAALGRFDFTDNSVGNAAANAGTLSIAPAASGATATLNLPINMTMSDEAQSTFTFAGSITARASALPGDANFDGIVNLADFNILAANFGMSGRGWLGGDFNFDNVVNLMDFNRLAANFGMSATGEQVRPDDWAALASAVPEPAVAWGAVLAGVLLRRARANTLSRKASAFPPGH